MATTSPERRSRINQVGKRGVEALPRIRGIYREGADPTRGEPIPREVTDGHTTVDDPFRDQFEGAQSKYRNEDPEEAGIAGGDYSFEASVYSHVGDGADRFAAAAQRLRERHADPSEVRRQLEKEIAADFKERGHQLEVDNAQKAARHIADILLGQS